MDSQLSEILHFFLIYVVKQGVNGEVSSEGILQGRAELLALNCGVFRVSLCPQIDKVDQEVVDSQSGCLEMLRLLRVLRNDSVPSSGDVVRQQILMQENAEVFTHHPIQGDIDVAAFFSQKLVSDPPPGHSELQV